MRCPRATGLPSHISSPSPTSTDLLIFMRRSSAAAFSERRQQGCVWARSDREYLADRQRRRRPTPDKPSMTLSVPADPDKVSSFLNFRVADIRVCYELWKSRGA